MRSPTRPFFTGSGFEAGPLNVEQASTASGGSSGGRYYANSKIAAEVVLDRIGEAHTAEDYTPEPYY